MKKALLTALLALAFGAARANTAEGADTLLTAESQYRLFSPLTFSGAALSKAFSLDEKADNSAEEVSQERAVDGLLMGVYLSRPDLVCVTDRTLSLADELQPAITAAKEQQVKVMEDKKIDVAKDDVPAEEPQPIVVSKPKFWTFKGDYFIQALQNYFSDNWHKGGESSVSVLGSAVFEANYNNKSKITWDNKLEMRLGMQWSRSDTIHPFKPSEDLLRYTGKLGIQAAKRWYYTLQAIATTQFMRGYKTNDEFVYSDFGSPLTVNVSIGMSYTINAFGGKLTGTALISPLAYNYKYVGRTALLERNGLDPRWHHSDDFGSSLTVDFIWQILSNLKWKTRLQAFTSYKRVEAEWENTFTFSFNKYITANLFLHPRFDDNRQRDPDYGYFQLREYSSLGFAYSF